MLRQGVSKVGRCSARLKYGPIRVPHRNLNVHEYQSAALMKSKGVNVPFGVAVQTVEEAVKAAAEIGDDEIVIKSQILAGGRGLGTFTNGLQGGVHIIKSADVAEYAGKMLGGTLVTKQTGPAGKPVSTLLLAKKMNLVNEMYFAILLDRVRFPLVSVFARYCATYAMLWQASQGPMVIACAQGGTSIEDLAEEDPDQIIKVPIDPVVGMTDADATAIVKGLEVSGPIDAAKEQVQALYKLFIDADCTMVEVNPLAEDDTGLLSKYSY